MTDFRVALLAAVLVAPGAAEAGDGESDRPQVGKPGVYVVSSCGTVVGYGATEAAARRAFPRAVREARRGWSNMAKSCALLKLTDVVHIAPGQQPAFYVVGSRVVKDRERETAVRRCQQGEQAEHKARPDALGSWECDRVQAVYGPFQRKPVRHEFGSEDAYVFLDDQGEWLDENGTAVCFPAGTAVATPDGDRPIETLAPGSRVLSWSADRGAPVPARVLDVKRRRAHELLELTLADGRTLRVSANHPLFVPARNDWVAAGELRAGAELGVLTEGRLAPVAIKQVATRVVDVDVFDLTVETTHSYFAGGALAHNY